MAMVLGTILGRSRRKFDNIEHLMHEAVPDLGSLQTPARGGNTEMGFLAGKDEFFVHLHDMGGGIEQLLMIITVLLTTDETSTLFVEEPESHLHPGAQRFLLEKLRGGARQVFLTTHSPILVNTGRFQNVYQVVFRDKQTTVNRLDDTDSLGRMLEDVGARNSDLLLSDAVLFVEGPADERVLSAWSESLGTAFAERNVTVLPMGGGEHAPRGAPIRSDVLQGISQRSPIPHLFIIDRDERGTAEIEGLRQTLGERVCILGRRELENYLLVPRAIRAAIRCKCQNSPPVLEKIERTTDDELAKLMNETAKSLYSIILLKRIRAELGGLQGGFLPRQLLAELVRHANDPKLWELIRDRVQTRNSEQLDRVNIESIVLAKSKSWTANGPIQTGILVSHQERKSLKKSSASSEPVTQSPTTRCESPPKCGERKLMTK